MQQPQLAELTGVTLSSQPGKKAPARRDIEPPGTDASIAAIASPVESAATLETKAEFDAEHASAGSLGTDSSSQPIPPAQQPMIDSVAQSSKRSAAASNELPRQDAAELLWGISNSSQPNSLEEWATPSALLHGAAEHQTCDEKPMHALGTALNWADKPEDAYRIAAEQKKLVFLIHVSGNFEIPGYT